MKARTALLELFKESSGWRAFFRSCCETSAFRLRSQAWQFRDELNDRGHQFQADEVEDSLLGLARELLPDAPAAQWDAEWAHALCKDALAHLAERYAEFSSADKEMLNLSAKICGTSGCMRPDWRTTRLPSGWRSKVGRERDSKLWNGHESREVRMSSSSGTDGLSLAKGGPATEEGKEVVRWNATRHGIRSPAPVSLEWRRRRTGRSTGMGSSRACSRRVTWSSH